MTDRYVRSTDGNNADDGSTWALATADLVGVASIDTVGDRIFVSDNHAETTAAAISLAFAGTLASPTQIICGDDAAEPPTAVAATGSVSTTGTSNIELLGNVYVYGLTFNAGDGANAGDVRAGASGIDTQKYKNCTFNIRGTNSGAKFRPRGQTIEMEDCLVNFTNTAHAVVPVGRVTFRDGGISPGTTTPTSFVLAPGVSTLFDSFDLSNFAATVNLVGSISNSGLTVFRHCKLPASWSGSLVTSSPTVYGGRVEMWNCDSGDTNYRLWIEDYAGSIKSETTLVKTGGASDGDTPLSWKMATTANAEYPLVLLRSPEIFSERITSTGSAKTITVDILHDSATALKDDEIWLEVQYLGTSGFPLGSFANDSKADVLAAGANQASSSATWTTTGMGNPNKQKLEVTFTPQEKGVAIVTVCMAKASYTVYVDPLAVVS